MDKPASEKSSGAYRTISEVATDLDLPQHVLRFWETRFPQVRPLKRAGGRRFYRPADVALLRSIRTLLYRDGYTIKGVQRLLRERGAGDRAVLAGDSSGSGLAVAGLHGPPPQASGPTIGVDHADGGGGEGLVHRESQGSGGAASGPDDPGLGREVAAPAMAPEPSATGAAAADARVDGRAASGEGLGTDRLRQALALVEECERMLGAALAPGA